MDSKPAWTCWSAVLEGVGVLVREVEDVGVGTSLWDSADTIQREPAHDSTYG